MSSYPRPVLCPVCRFPTLYQSTMYEICQVCWWMDDGRGKYDPAVDAAQAQFADHGHMYPLAHDMAARISASAERRAFDAYLRSVGFDPARADVAIWGPLLEAENARSLKAHFPDG